MIRLSEARDELARVQRMVNRRVKYKTDTDLYGKAEFWASAEGAGDCEDYALAKYRELRKSGFRQADFDFATCWVENNGEYHAVLIAHTDEGDYVLDNRHAGIKKKESLQYRWHKQSVGGRLKEWKFMTDEPVTESKSARSVRNNNPGNIERDGDKWKGLAEDQSSDNRFCVFTHPKWGFRALAMLLENYQDKYGLNTIDAIIHRWAPPSDNNDTNAYAAAVALRAGFARRKELNLQTYEHIKPLVKAIAIHESGGWFFDDADLEDGLRLAGFRAPATSLAESRTVQGVAVATTAATVKEVVDQIEPALGTWQVIADFAPTVGLCVLVLGLGWILYARIDDYRRAKR